MKEKTFEERLQSAIDETKEDFETVQKEKMDEEYKRLKETPFLNEEKNYSLKGKPLQEALDTADEMLDDIESEMTLSEDELIEKLNELVKKHYTEQFIVTRRAIVSSYAIIKYCETVMEAVGKKKKDFYKWVHGFFLVVTDILITTEAVYTSKKESDLS